MIFQHQKDANKDALLIYAVEQRRSSEVLQRLGMTPAEVIDRTQWWKTQEPSYIESVMAAYQKLKSMYSGGKGG